MNYPHWLHLLSVSWPRRAEIHNERWVGTPEWDAPIMPSLPPWRLHVFDGVECNALDWTDIFRIDMPMLCDLAVAEMRGFYVVFRLRVRATGHLAFFDTDGCIIRRNGKIVHEDRERHPVRPHEMNVWVGDRLEIAHWQSGGSWIWGARWFGRSFTLDESLQDVEQYRFSVEEALTRAEGPVLKVFTSGVAPVRCALSIYSLVLNGYRPAGIKVFGDYQWNARSTCILQKLLPFAEIVSLSRVERTLDALNPGLMPLARRNWGAMKICIGLFFPPREYCFLDDDIFVVGRMDDAFQLWDRHDFVHAPDNMTTFRYSPVRYPKRPGSPEPAPRNLSTGIYLLKNHADLEAQSERLVNTPRDGHPSWFWEQGFFSWEFAYGSAVVLPSQRYFVPGFDGLPGGFYGYDWERNPCEFVCVHFGGPAPKPGDREAGSVFHDILGRRRTATAVRSQTSCAADAEAPVGRRAQLQSERS